jgi:hypothetical protein
MACTPIPRLAPPPHVVAQRVDEREIVAFFFRQQ